VSPASGQFSAKKSLFAIYSQLSRESASLAGTISAWTPPPSTLRSVHVWRLNAYCVAGISNAQIKLYMRTHALWQKLCASVEVNFQERASGSTLPTDVTLQKFLVS